jgi:ribonuclease VapC
MIVDSSALVAMLWREPEGEAFAKAITAERSPAVSAANYLEAGIVIDRERNPALSAKLDALIAELGINIVPVTAEHARIARQAYRDFGKGSGHTAKLNYGDCFAYALAMERGEALLYKGNDFVHAGLTRVV